LENNISFPIKREWFLRKTVDWSLMWGRDKRVLKRKRQVDVLERRILLSGETCWLFG
jgi:hypothetical protein